MTEKSLVERAKVLRVVPEKNRNLDVMEDCRTPFSGHRNHKYFLEDIKSELQKLVGET